MTNTTATSRVKNPRVIITAGAIVLAAIIVIILFITGIIHTPQTYDLTQTPQLTGTPAFAKTQTAGFKLEENPSGSSLQNSIRLTRTDTPQNVSCTASLNTTYLPAAYTITGDDGKLSQAYLKLLSGSIPNLTKPTTTNIQTTTGDKLTFLQTNYNITSQINPGINTQISNYIAVRVINHKIAHKTYSMTNPSKTITETTPVALIATYQCTGTKIKTADWNKLLTTQKIKL